MGCVASSEKKSVTEASHSGELPREYSVEAYESLLAEALRKGHGDLVIKALQEISFSQRGDVAQAYHDNHPGKSWDSCSDQLEPMHAFTAGLLLEAQPTSTARYLHRLLSATGIIRELTVMRIIFSLDQPRLVSLAETYRDVISEDLTTVLRTKCSEELGDILAGRVTTQSKMEKVDVNEYAEKLVLAANENAVFGPESLFPAYMKTLYLDDLREILESFLKRTQRDISVEVERHYPEGRKRDILQAMASFVRNPELYESELLQQLLRQPDSESMQEMLFMILCRSEDGLRSLKMTYKKTCLEMLARDIKEDVKDAFVQRVLLKAVK